MFSSSMEGFGSTDLGTPFNYGSVKDGYSQNPTLEHKIKKQYWKTKQTVRQKLNKHEDEFVVAGDAAIDSKLEKARHLETSCTQLVNAAKLCCYHTKSVSYYEEALGNFLSSCGELDFTLAGQIMTKTGGVHKTNAEMRLKLLPAFLRLQAETATFTASGLGDLSWSIENLEKARKDYRAALLWMKDVSEKLRNPDAKYQLTRFREAQAHVKQTKESFEHLKGLLSEKIEMVSASRCNLLSKNLPGYQTAMLNYLDESANELYKVLTELRSQTQHQYKVNELAKEIRDLEVDESGFEMGIPRTPEIGETTTGDSPTHNEPKTSKKQKDDNTLFGLLQGEIVSTPSQAPPKDTKEEKDQTTPKITSQPSESSNVHEHQEDLNSESNAPPITQPTDDELGNLLSLLDAPLESSSGSMVVPPLSSTNNGGSGNEWDMYLEQQQQKDAGDDDDGGWGELVRHAQQDQDELRQGDGWSQGIIVGGSSEDINEFEKEIDRLLASNDTTQSSDDKEEKPITKPEDTFDPLAQPSNNQAPPSNQGSSDQLRLDPALFQSQGPTPMVPPPLIPQTTSSLPLPILPSPITRVPYSAGTGTQGGMGSGLNTVGNTVGGVKGSGGGGTLVGGAQGGGGAKSGKEGDKKKVNWMNVFAHLDPIANEKA